VSPNPPGHIAISFGQAALQLTTTYPYRWLYVPKSVAMFYVPVRNQHLIRSTLPTSFGLVPKDTSLKPTVVPRPDSGLGDSAYISNFAYYGTLDNSAIYCVPEAVRFRKEVCGGEEKIRKYCRDLVWEGAEIVASTLGTRMMEVPSQDSPMVNVLLPLELTSEGKLVLDAKVSDGSNKAEVSSAQIVDWLGRTMVERNDTFMATMEYQGSMWVRLSGQIYLEREDFVRAGEILKTLCEEVRTGAVGRA
jgi:selenocysteine lyase/cysteine desulfurase